MTIPCQGPMDSTLIMKMGPMASKLPPHNVGALVMTLLLRAPHRLRREASPSGNLYVQMVWMCGWLRCAGCDLLFVCVEQPGDNVECVPENLCQSPFVRRISGTRHVLRIIDRARDEIKDTYWGFSLQHLARHPMSRWV